MRIYLAGKMDAEHGAWRDAIIGSGYNAAAQRTFPRWELAHTISEDYDIDDLDVPPWPKAPNQFVLGMHEYVGPYRWTFAPVEPEPKHLGYFHGSEGYGNHGYDMSCDTGRRLIVSECTAAIERADLVFAYMNSPDCFGTLVEIGMAKALGKFVYLAYDHDASWEGSDYWFTEELVDASRVVLSLDDDERVMLGGDFVHDRIRHIFKDAIVAWTGRAPKAQPVSLVGREDTEPYIRALQEAAGSLGQIARWTADPRVRNEAQRMLKRIVG